MFVTRKYIHKVQFGDDLDNVRREFMYAQSRGKRMIAIKFDDLLPKKWQGPVGMLLGSSLYVDLVDSASQKGITTLVSTIRKAAVKCQMNSVMTTAQVAVRLRTPSPQRRRPLSPRPIRGKTNLTESVTHNNQNETTIKKRLDRAAMLVGITPSTSVLVYSLHVFKPENLIRHPKSNPAEKNVNFLPISILTNSLNNPGVLCNIYFRIINLSPHPSCICLHTEDKNNQIRK